MQKKVATMSASDPTQMPMSFQKRLEPEGAASEDRPPSKGAVASDAPVAEAFAGGAAPYASFEDMPRDCWIVLHREMRIHARARGSRSLDAHAVSVRATRRRRSRRNLCGPVDSATGSVAVHGAVCWGRRVAVETRRFAGKETTTREKPEGGGGTPEWSVRRSWKGA